MWSKESDIWKKLRIAKVNNEEESYNSRKTPKLKWTTQPSRSFGEQFFRLWHQPGFFLDISKKLKPKKTQAEKNLKQIFEKLKQIIQKLNNLPT